MVLRAEVIQSSMNFKAGSGELSKKEFVTAFNGNEGITVQFSCTSTQDNTPMKTCFSWKSVLQLKQDVYFFGPPLDSTRKYNDIFRAGRSVDYITKIYWDMSHETYGDYFKSSCLNIAYQSRMSTLQSDQTKRAEFSYWRMDFNEHSNKTEHYNTTRFFNVFDICCKLAFFKAILELQNHNESIISMNTFDFFVGLAPKCLPKLWEHMCNLRNVAGNRTSQGKGSIHQRKRQTLLQILALRRMRNPRMLVWWSLIQSVAFYGWGVGRSALDATHFWGMSCSARSRDRLLGLMTKNLGILRIKYLARLPAIGFKIDNYEERQSLLHLRGGHTSTQFSGTNEIALQIRLYNNTSFDGQHVPVMYIADQDYVSGLI